MVKVALLLQPKRLIQTFPLTPSTCVKAPSKTFTWLTSRSLSIWNSSSPSRGKCSRNSNRMLPWLPRRREWHPRLTQFLLCNSTPSMRRRARMENLTTARFLERVLKHKEMMATFKMKHSQTTRRPRKKRKRIKRTKRTTRRIRRRSLRKVASQMADQNQSPSLRGPNQNPRRLRTASPKKVARLLRAASRKRAARGWVPNPRWAIIAANQK